MMHVRPLRNDDPPALVSVWQHQAPGRGVMQPMTPLVLEELVLAKPYFDPQGFLVAVQNGEVVGFAHASFGSTPDGTGLDHSSGMTCLLMANPDQDPGLLQDLLVHSEAYLTERGAQTLYGGCHGCKAPFYLGLYGGSSLPGILTTDTRQTASFQTAGYEERARTFIWQRELSGFRPPINRQTMQLRRQTQLVRTGVDPPRNWWDACCFGHTDRVRFELISSGDNRLVAAATFWDMEPLASSWGVHAMGLLELEVLQEEQEQLLQRYMLGESLRELEESGTTLIEVQTLASETGLDDVCRALDFREIGQGVQFVKTV